MHKHWRDGLSAGLDVQRRPKSLTLLARAVLMGVVLAAQLPLAAGAQGGLHVVEAPAPTYDFGGSIAFHLTAESTANINSATLFINTGGLTPATYRSDPFQ